jgi:stage V sporulation protein G
VDITEVRIKLMDEAGDRLRAFCSITFDDCFVVRDLKIIEGSNGPFVAMPSRKLTAHCTNCGCKNHLRAGFCNQCGKKLDENLAIKDSEGRAKLYADIAHPINSACREMIQDRVIRAYQEELKLSQQPGYRSRYDDFYDAGEEGSTSEYGGDAPPRPARTEPAVAKTEHTHIESPEFEKRGPHTSPAAKKPDAGAPGVPNAPHQSKKRKFGEGVFE